MIENQLGTTMTIEWPVYIEDSDTPLVDMDLSLYVVSGRFKKELDIEVENNTISFTFQGKDQRVAGVYDLELYVNEDENDQMLLKNKAAFNLYR